MEPTESSTPAAAVRAWLSHAERRGWVRPLDPRTEPDGIDEAIEELMVAEHELRVQNEELIATSTELERERTRYLELFEAAPDAYLVTDGLGVIRRANRAAHELFGIAAPQLDGKPLAVLVPRDERGEFRAHLSHLDRLERLTNWESSVESRAGGRVPVSISAVPAPLGGPLGLEIRWLMRDLRPQYAADNAKRRLRQEHAARLASERAVEQVGFLAAAGRAFLEVQGVAEMARRIARHAVPRLADVALLCVRENDRLRCCAARHRDPLHAAAMHALIDRDLDPDLFDGPLRVARTGELDLVPRVDPGFVGDCLGLARHDGWMTTLGLSLAVPLRERGSVRGVLWLLNDRERPYDVDLPTLAETYADRAMAALHAALIHDELLNARDEAARANEEKARAFATLSHDFRTPLAAVIGYTDLILEGVVPDVPQRVLDWIGRIRVSTEHQLCLVDQVLAYTRLENGREQVHIQPVDLCGLARSTAELVRREAEQAGLELRVDCPEGGVVADTDAGKVRQILTNLLSNALRFTQAGYVGLRVMAEADHALLTVEDTGVGISAEAQHHVFERYWQAEPKTETSSNVGLGLTITRELTHLLGGTIELDSEPGRGTTFRIRLPLRRG